MGKGVLTRAQEQVAHPKQRKRRLVAIQCRVRVHLNLLFLTSGNDSREVLKQSASRDLLCGGKKERESTASHSVILLRCVIQLHHFLLHGLK